MVEVRAQSDGAEQLRTAPGFLMFSAAQPSVAAQMDSAVAHRCAFLVAARHKDLAVVVGRGLIAAG
ncbi:hypothetical protein [Streptomyces tauricus]|uniref:hypothetical protein n=1 Tax=Streptomyces tauricus TaxID=68274 RepID=UPI002243DF9C|nr:hypothetical protein [Streptomyces tauricus]MCW8101664.1 hypothetical protein [Streptomyces tauricus]